MSSVCKGRVCSGWASEDLEGCQVFQKESVAAEKEEVTMVKGQFSLCRSLLSKAQGPREANSQRTPPLWKVTLLHKTALSKDTKVLPRGVLLKGPATSGPVLSPLARSPEGQGTSFFGPSPSPSHQQPGTAFTFQTLARNPAPGSGPNRATLS